MTSKHSTGGGHSPSVGRAGGLGEAERRAGEREQNPPDDAGQPGGGAAGAGRQQQAEASDSADGDRPGRDPTRQQGGDLS